MRLDRSREHVRWSTEIRTTRGMEHPGARTSRRGALLRWGLVAGSVLAFAPSLGGPDATASGIIYGAGARATPLTAAEEADPLAVELARRFEPGDGAARRRRPLAGRGQLRLDDGADRWRGRATLPVTSFPSASRPAIEVLRGGGGWGDLASRDAEGRELEYFIDAPGDDGVAGGTRGGATDDSAWRVRCARAGRAPARWQRLPAYQYAHLFWLDRPRGLLAIQYWFYFPFNEWINHHEGDWEHVNVILQGPSDFASRAPFRAVGQQFFFHGWRFEPARTVRARGAGGDHLWPSPAARTVPVVARQPERRQLSLASALSLGRRRLWALERRRRHPPPGPGPSGRGLSGRAAARAVAPGHPQAPRAVLVAVALPGRSRSTCGTIRR